MLLANDALPMSVATSKAGQAKRFASITEAVDKLTVEYFFDAAKQRKLDTVADGGLIDTSPDAQLPDPVTDDGEPAEAPASDGPPPADDGEASGTF